MGLESTTIERRRDEAGNLLTGPSTHFGGCVYKNGIACAAEPFKLFEGVVNNPHPADLEIYSGPCEPPRKDCEHLTALRDFLIRQGLTVIGCDMHGTFGASDVHCSVCQMTFHSVHLDSNQS